MLALMNTATHGADALTVRLGSIEELVWLYDQTSPFHFVMGATFVGAGTAAPWREVLDVLQWRHPLLRVRIERDASAYPKFVTDEAARIPLRMGDADIGWAGEMSRELQIPLVSATGLGGISLAIGNMAALLKSGEARAQSDKPHAPAW